LNLGTNDVLAITKLLADYNFAVDAGDGDAAVAYFASGGTLSVGSAFPVFEGIDAIRDFARGAPARRPGIQHVASNVSIDGSGDHATARSYLHLYQRPDDGGPTYLFSTGRFYDTLVKSDGAWRFQSRELQRNE
jgi:ketosteroid isomerase-like protein